jgi:hypothetical protein
MTTNLLPDLPEWEFEKVIAPVVKDENGDIINGHQRVRAFDELGIKDYPCCHRCPPRNTSVSQPQPEGHTPQKSPRK